MKFSYVKKEKINTIPKTAGVYVFLNKKDILYIGKAANLRDRTKTHFTQPSYRDNLFISQVTRVEYIETQSAIDALLLESKLIKEHQPKYNVIWKDDKGYFYVGITTEKLPRVFLTHQPSAIGKKSEIRNPKSLPRRQAGETNSKSLNTKYQILNTKYIGPFVDGKAIKQVLRLLRKAFPYYTARKHPVLPCPYCHIGLCPGPRPDIKEYKQNIRHLISVLRGRRVSVLKNLKKSMAQASKEQNFERAAALRDQIFSLENVASHVSLVSLSYPHLSEDRGKRMPKPWSGYQRIEAYDISNIQGKQATGSMVTFISGKPAKEWYRKFKIHPVIRRGAPSNDRAHPNDYAMIEQVISRRLKHTEWPYPDLMLIDGGKGQLSSALKAISTLARLRLNLSRAKVRAKVQRIRVVALAKRNNKLFSPGQSNPVPLKDLPQGVFNLLLHIRDEAHRFAISYHHKLRRVDWLAGT